MTMNIKTKARLQAAAILIASIAWVMIPAAVLASDNKKKPTPVVNIDNRDYSGQDRSVNSEAKAVANSDATALGGNATINIGTSGGGVEGQSVGGSQGALSSHASNDGVQVDASDNSRIENNSTNVVLVPNNNTSNCMRVWGVSFGGREGAAALGIPTRDAACDFELAADDAAATGSHDIAWYWRCHKKNLYKQFRNGSRDDRGAIMSCFNQMREMISVPGQDEPLPVGQVIITEDEYDSLLMAQVQKEEIEEYTEQAEYRYAQQQSQLEELKEEIALHDMDEVELERLKQQAAELRREQEARKAAEIASQSKFKERLAAKQENEES